MSFSHFSLIPFVKTAAPAGLEITGNIDRNGNRLHFDCLLSGNLSQLAIPGPADIRCRSTGLWEQTCFELFLAPKGIAQYRELNMSPAGDWNVYRFTGYREGMQEDMAFASLPFTVGRGPDYLSILLEVQLDAIIGPAQSLEAAISAVIRDKNGEMSYWALTHFGPRPDFHRRDSFLIEL